MPVSRAAGGCVCKLVTLHKAGCCHVMIMIMVMIVSW